MVVAADRGGGTVSTPTACRVLVEGVVQGVGFRPFVHTIARRYQLAGRVRNTSRGVEIEVEGDREEIGEFVAALRDRPPPLARIERIEAREIVPSGVEGFRIDPSADGDGFLPVSADVATCQECLREIEDVADRRFGYPFTNCTNCGPRFTIVRSVPYDRPNTTMAEFEMCSACRAEYEDPTDRRFHAEPIACPQCGPSLALADTHGGPVAGDPLAESRRALAHGRIVAIKGIGGFHLACDARQEMAVRRLRRRKLREGKPFALMAADLAEVERICLASAVERRLLESRARPIVVLRERADSGIAAAVARPLCHLGVMLPYSPLHALLFSEPPCPRSLVLTSGNRGGEPIARDGEEALERLGEIADLFLVHDRSIEVRCDDSVVRVVGAEELPIRRSRGYAPYPMRLPLESPPLLACGADLKSTVCVARGRHAFLSPHVGDLEDAETWRSYARMAAHMESIFRVRPEAIVHDAHPEYFSTRYALERDPSLPHLAVQHHHAHVVSCMIENEIGGSVIGVAFDGTGYGADGAIWGGEFLVADHASFERGGHLAYVPMPGATRAIREPFRMGLAHLIAARGSARGMAADAATDAEIGAVEWQIAHGVNAPLTSSIGRLFDAVASLVGVRHRALYEGQAAMELEACAAHEEAEFYPFPITGERPMIANPGPLVAAVAEEVARGISRSIVSARFHNSVARMVVEMCERIRASSGLDRVVLSGGVFQNATLLEQTVARLAARGFTPYRHRKVPPNDGGIALGQAAIAAARLTEDR
jgi:hydrogenase maturation protein HypF